MGISRAEHEAQIRKLREACLGDFYYFCYAMMGYRDMYRPLHQRVCDFLTTPQKKGKWIKLVLIPRGHLKSSIVTTAYPLWYTIKETLRRPEEPPATMMTQATQKVIEDFLRPVRLRLEAEAGLWSSVFPEVFWKNPVKEAPVGGWVADGLVLRRQQGAYRKEATIMARSLEKAVTGFHPDLHVHDDLVGPTNSGPHSTGISRSGPYNFLEQMKLLFRPGRKQMVIVGTRWHQDDAYGRILENEGWQAEMDTLVLDCWEDEEARIPLFPLVGDRAVGWTADSLDAARAADPLVFNACMRNQPWLDASVSLDPAKVDWYDLLPSEVAQGGVRTLAVDLNVNTDPSKDPAVVTLGIRTADNHLWVEDVMWGHPEWNVLMEWVKSMSAQHGVRKVLVETVQAQAKFYRDLVSAMEGTGVQIVAVPRGGYRQSSKQDRIAALLHPLVQGRLHVNQKLGLVRNEMRGYNLKAQKNKDDVLDTIADLWTLVAPPREGVAPEVRVDTDGSRILKYLDRSVAGSGRFRSRLHKVDNRRRM